MIQESHLPELLTKLGFTGKKYLWKKSFLTCELAVDINKQQLIYPTDKGMTIGGEFTSNFSSPENFVVFECVDRLLSKGYKPEHIELEPKRKVGHGASGGRADILVKDHNDKPLLVIECKTAGKEFDKYRKKTLLDGDQLFSYAQQISEVQFLCMYASDIIDGELQYTSHIIAHRDNDDYLSEHPDLKSYKDANKVEERYQVWKHTYTLDFTTKGIFEDNIQAYIIGKDKYTVDDLLAISSSDQRKKYHEFATILRKYNVSERENAFNKLVNLFLCKIVDEQQNPDNLKFYRKGVAYDNHYDLMDRLQQLYKYGMEEFLDDEITYISNHDIKKAFRFVKSKKDQTLESIQQLFRQQKYYTNSDFSFVEVHNEKGFYHNIKILLEVVQMWQDLKIKTESHNQFLGDMFEGFLDQGVKQSEGQFFTPMPICRFINMSLPLTTLITTEHKIPKVIDYACGSGHFLNEIALQTKQILAQQTPHHELVPLMKGYYANITGIEKEYRLSKIAKVSAFMYGQNEIQIINSDALAPHDHIRLSSFDILVANPPYSVKGFLETLSEEQMESYKLIDTVDDKSISTNNSIETFFIERAMQLLAPGGVAAIVLPSSILSNSNNTYVTTREIILAYFDIVAVAEFGSGTFGKTGTNTVTLFLRRKQTNPDTCEHYRSRVISWFDGGEGSDIYADMDIIREYAQQIGVEYTDYVSLLHGEPNDTLLAHELFVDYRKDYDGQKTKKQRLRLEYLRTIESEKLYYFALASDQSHPVVIVKSPSDNKEQKSFLGYERSGSKGSEGIQIVKDSHGHHITPLYDEANRHNSDKINTLISDNFDGKALTIPAHLSDTVTTARLVDMLDWSRVSFDKQISLTPKKTVMIESKWPVKSIEYFLKNIEGNTTKIQQNEIKENGKVPVITQEQDRLIAGYCDADKAISDLPLLIFGDHSCTIKYVDFPFVRGADGTQLLKTDPQELLPKYLYQYLGFINIPNKEKYERHFKYLKTLKIPLPPLDIQEQIVQACEQIDQHVSDAQQQISTARATIEELVSEVVAKGYEMKKLGDVAKDMFAGGDVDKNNFSDTKTEEYQIPIFANAIKDKGLYGYTNKARVTEPAITISARGTLGYTEIRTEPFYPIVRLIVVIPKDDISPFYLKHIVSTLNFTDTGGTIPQLTVPKVSNYIIPVPPLDIQTALVAQIAQQEQIITTAQQIIDQSAHRKQSVMREWL